MSTRKGDKSLLDTDLISPRCLLVLSLALSFSDLHPSVFSSPSPVSFKPSCMNDLQLEPLV